MGTIYYLVDHKNKRTLDINKSYWLGISASQLSGKMVNSRDIQRFYDEWKDGCHHAPRMLGLCLQFVLDSTVQVVDDCGDGPDIWRVLYMY